MRTLRHWRASEEAGMARYDGKTASSTFDEVAARLEAKAERDKADEKARRERERRKRLGLPEHGSEGRFEPGERIVDDPYQPGAKLAVKVNRREHPLEYLASARGRKGKARLNESQYAAGRRFREIYERAQIGALKAFDPGKVRVDGGALAAPLSAQVMQAHEELRVVAWALGPVGYPVVAAVVGEGRTLAEVAERWRGAISVDDEPQMCARSAGDVVLFVLQRGLDELGVLWGAVGPESLQRRRFVARALGVFFPDPSDDVMREVQDRYFRKRRIEAVEVEERPLPRRRRA